MIESLSLLVSFVVGVDWSLISCLSVDVVHRN